MYLRTQVYPMRNAQHEKMNWRQASFTFHNRFCFKSVYKDHCKRFPVIYMSIVFISITHLMSHVQKNHMSHVKQKKMGKTL